MPDHNPDRSKAYSAATSRLREANRDEFDGYLSEEYAKYGIVFNPKPSEVAKARAEIERLLAAHPELRRLFAIGADPANEDAVVQPGAVQRTEEVADAPE
jgi:hypothetical protein